MGSCQIRGAFNIFEVSICCRKQKHFCGASSDKDLFSLITGLKKEQHMSWSLNVFIIIVSQLIQMATRAWPFKIEKSIFKKTFMGIFVNLAGFVIRPVSAPLGLTLTFITVSNTMQPSKSSYIENVSECKRSSEDTRSEYFWAWDAAAPSTEKDASCIQMVSKQSLYRKAKLKYSFPEW